MSTEAIIGVFVYGTLKRGQCREGMWPSQPLGVEPAWVHGHLYGRSDYPAMIAGKDRVQGELWRFPADAFPQVLEVLDEIEGANQSASPDVYHREVLEVFDASLRCLGRAFVYRYATDPTRDGFDRMYPNHAGAVAWPP